MSDNPCEATVETALKLPTFPRPTSDAVYVGFDDAFAHAGTVGSVSVKDWRAVSALPKDVCTALAKSVLGIPPDGLEYVPLLFHVVFSVADTRLYVVPSPTSSCVYDGFDEAFAHELTSDAGSDVG